MKLYYENANVAVPTVLQCALASNDVYSDHEDDELTRQGLFRIADSGGSKPSGYFGALYVNNLHNPTFSIMAHRGTDSLKDILEDINILRQKSLAQMRDSVLLMMKFRQLLLDRYRLFVDHVESDFWKRVPMYMTGHSLGAVLADSNLDEGLKIAGSITFENPGSKVIAFEALKYPEYGQYAQARAVCYQSQVNIINTCNEQLGKVKRFLNKPYNFENIPDASQTNPFEIPWNYAANLYYSLDYTYDQHIMLPLLEHIKSGGIAFDSDSPIGLQAGYKDYLNTQKHQQYWHDYFYKIWLEARYLPTEPDFNKFYNQGIAAVEKARSQTATENFSISQSLLSTHSFLKYQKDDFVLVDKPKQSCIIS